MQAVMCKVGDMDPTEWPPPLEPQPVVPIQAESNLAKPLTHKETQARIDNICTVDSGGPSQSQSTSSIVSLRLILAQPSPPLKGKAVLDIPTPKSALTS